MVHFHPELRQSRSAVSSSDQSSAGCARGGARLQACGDEGAIPANQEGAWGVRELGACVQSGGCDLISFYHLKNSVPFVRLNFISSVQKLLKQRIKNRNKDRNVFLPKKCISHDRLCSEKTEKLAKKINFLFAVNLVYNKCCLSYQ